MEDSSSRSAQLIVPQVLRLFPAESVVDVGCGRGSWLRAFADHGVRSIRGIDGSYVDLARLVIPRDCFTAADLSGPFQIPGQFDLAICLEVGEHLPADSASHLVAELITSAPVVLFSAAVPGQCGRGHVNEQWPDYWRRLFAVHGYRLIDPIRGLLFQDQCVDWWYRQNLVVYCAEHVANEQSVRQYLVEDDRPAIEWVHRDVEQRPDLTSIPGRMLVRLLVHRVVKRIGLLGRNPIKGGASR